MFITPSLRLGRWRSSLDSIPELYLIVHKHIHKIYVIFLTCIIYMSTTLISIRLLATDDVNIDFLLQNAMHKL